MRNKRHTLCTGARTSTEKDSNSNHIAISAKPKTASNLLHREGHSDPDFDAESAAEDAPADHANAVRDPGLLTGHLARRRMAGEERYHWDGELPGFGLRVYASGRKRWIVQFRKRNTFRRVTIGKAEELSAVDARRMARALLAENALEGLPQRPKIVRSDPRFTAYAEEFWHDYAGHWKASTCARNRQAIDKTLKPAFGLRYIGTLTRAEVLAWRAGMAGREGAFNRELPVLAAMLGYAEKLGYRRKGSNPCIGIPRYKRQLPERYLTAPEYARLGRVLRSLEPSEPQLVAALWLLIFTGARCGEIQSLRREWIDPPYIHLPDSKTGPKRLYLNNQALAVLEHLGREGEGPMFQSRTGGPLHLGPAWCAIRRKALLPDVRLHDLRHSFASVAIAEHISLTAIGRLLGHALPETTARYAHLADDAVQDAATRVSGSIAQALCLTA